MMWSVKKKCARFVWSVVALRNLRSTRNVVVVKMVFFFMNDNYTRMKVKEFVWSVRVCAPSRILMILLNVKIAKDVQFEIGFSGSNHGRRNAFMNRNECRFEKKTSQNSYSIREIC